LGLDDFCLVVDLDNPSEVEKFDFNFPFYRCAATLFFNYLNIPQLEAQADLQLRRFFTPQANEKFFLWRQYFVPDSWGILEMGINWESGFEVNLTPLHLACELLLPKTTERLLCEGADPNSTCKYFGTPLSRLLLSGETDLSFVPTPLWECLRLRFGDPKDRREDCELQIFDILLSKGADIGQMVRCPDVPRSGSFGPTSLLCVALALQKQIILIQLCKTAFNLPVEICFGRNCENLICLLKYQMELVSYEDYPSHTMLFWKDFIKCVMDLYPPWAQDSQFLSIMNEILSESTEFGKKKAAIKERDDTTDQQFVLACRIGNEPAAIRLLAEGASIEALDLENKSALYLALQGGYWSIAFILLEAGSDLNAELPGNETPLDMAIGLCGDEELSKGVDTLTFIKQLVENDHNDIFCREAPKILHLACERDRIDIIELILGHSVDADVLVDGLAPIHSLLNGDAWAKEDVLELLLEHGADVSLRDNEGHTPLHLAVMCRETSQSLVRLLLDYGANRNEIDIAHRTPLHCACEKGDLGTAKCLLDYWPGR
jgi:ankyrin repeat protein